MVGRLILVSKVANIIYYRVAARSQFSDEIAQSGTFLKMDGVPRDAFLVFCAIAVYNSMALTEIAERKCEISDCCFADKCKPHIYLHKSTSWRDVWLLKPSTRDVSTMARSPISAQVSKKQTAHNNISLFFFLFNPSHFTF